MSGVSSVKNAPSEHCSNSFNLTKVGGFSESASSGGTQLKNVNYVKSPVRTRVFTNSTLNKRSIDSMLAKGNKVRILNTMGASLHNPKKVNQGCSIEKQVNVTSQSKEPFVYSKSVRHEGVVQEVDTELSAVSANLESTMAKKCMEKAVGRPNQAEPQRVHIESGVSDTSNEQHASNNIRALLFDINGLDDDKFVNTMFNKTVNEITKHQAELSCQNYAMWKQQSKFDFGFVPLPDFIIVPKHEGLNIEVADPVELHKLVKNSGTYNFLGLKIPLQGQMNVQQWENKLVGYWDMQLLELIRYGFPIDFNRQSPLRWEDKNHNSQDVDAYLSEELEFSAIMGPYDKSPIENCHFSPFLTRENCNASHTARARFCTKWT